jgi:RNA polymerase sigma factor for flagellar operon FliA
MNRTERNRMIVENLPLVGYLVSKVCAGATHLSRDDLSQAGSVALIQVVDSWDPERGIPFGAYARERIIGAIKDEMRGNDWAKRATRKTIKTTLAVQETLTSRLGRTPTVSELAGALGVDRATAAEGLSYATRTISSLDGITADILEADIVPAEAELLVTERLTYLRAAVEALPERMRYILTAIYYGDRTVGDIAAELGVTHSAISQQRAEAVRLLRDGLDHYYPDSDGMVLGSHRSAPGARRNSYLVELAARVPVLVPRISAAPDGLLGVG